MRRRGLILSGLVLVLVGLLAFLSGLANRVGLGPNLALLRAAARVERLPKVVPMPSMGLEARAPAGSSCRDTFGTHCKDERWRRFVWSLCRVAGPESPYARTPRTETCHPDEEEEGIAHDAWSQDEIGRVTLAGFAGYVVSWWPGAHAKRGSGCSFRGYRRDPSSGAWHVLHVEVSAGCDDDVLAVILSTRAAGEGA